MSDHNSSKLQNRLKPIIVLLLCILVVIGIIYMKRSTSEQKAVQTTEMPNSMNKQVAIPDTSADPSMLPTEPDTVEHYVLPDTLLGRDKRQPYEAGYEDGYTAGCDDGALGQERATYDETSNFHSPSERKTYTDGYREGYAKGLEDGRQGKQFNI